MDKINFFNKNQNRDSFIDFLKVIGCISIAFIHHNKMLPGIAPFFDNILKEYLLLFVEVFFICSGYCMEMRYSNKIKDLNLATYLNKRFRKIYAVYLITLIICIIEAYVFLYYGYNFVKDTSLDFFHIIQAILCIESGWFIGALSPNEAGWFVNVLLLDYLIFFFINKFAFKNRNIFYILLTLISITGIIYNWAYPFLFSYASLRGYSFFLGCLIFNYASELKKLKIIYSLILFIWGIYILIYLNFGETLNNYFATKDLLGFQLKFYYVYFIFVPIFIMGINSSLSNLFNIWIIRFINRYILEIYLSHFMLINFIGFLGHIGIIKNIQTYTITVIYIAGTFIISVILSKVVNSIFNKLTKETGIS